MTDLRTAAQQALEALEADNSKLWPSEKRTTAITDLRAALAEPVQEPVAWRYQDARGNYRYRGYVQGFDKEYSLLKPVPLYSTPPQRKPLTEEEIQELSHQHKFDSRMEKFVRIIEQAHGIGGSNE